MKAVLLALALLAVQDLDALIAKLSDDRIEVRDDAAAALRKAGARALPKLKEALPRAVEPAKALLRDLVEAIERDVVLGALSWEFLAPKDGVKLETALGNESFLKLRVTNSGDRPAAVPAWAELSIRDAEGREVDTSMYIGKLGVREGCVLRCFGFLEIPAKGSRELDFALANYGLDPEAMTGWKLPAAGTYALEFRVKYARKEFTARCPDGCKDHGAADRLWNRAPDLDRKFGGKLVVR